MDDEIQKILIGAEPRIVELGDLAARVADANQKQDTFRSQLSKLERVALQARTFVEIRAYVKRQMGKAQGREKRLWDPGSAEGFGARALELIDQLENSLRESSREPQVLLRNRVVERLAGAALRAVNSQFLYSSGRQR